MPSFLSNAAENKSGENAAGNYSWQKYAAEILLAKCYWKNAVRKILGANVADKILLGKC